MSKHDDRYDWLEFKVRPKKDGLHDSGYRFISVTGVKYGKKPGDEPVKTQLHEYADHVLLAGVTNIDVEEDGTIRLATWAGTGGWRLQDGYAKYFGSDAMFVAEDVEESVRSMKYFGRGA